MERSTSRNMMRPPAPRPEPRTAGGELLLSPSHLPLLRGLLDRADCSAARYVDWERSALPYLRRFTLQATIWFARRRRPSIHPDWIQRQKIGSRVQVNLSARDRTIMACDSD